jgi:hypothetical protein
MGKAKALLSHLPYVLCPSNDWRKVFFTTSHPTQTTPFSVTKVLQKRWEIRIEIDAETWEECFYVCVCEKWKGLGGIWCRVIIKWRVGGWWGAEGKVSVLKQMDDFKLNQRYLVYQAIERVTFHALHEDLELVLLKCVKTGGGGWERNEFPGILASFLLLY